MVIGWTKDGKFFMTTFDGRSESKGVTYSEMVQILYEQLGKDKIEWALNLDGGSSVGMTVINQSKAYTINYPTRGPINWTGEIRPVSTFGLLKKSSANAIGKAYQKSISTVQQEAEGNNEFVKQNTETLRQLIDDLGPEDTLTTKGAGNLNDLVSAMYRQQKNAKIIKKNINEAAEVGRDWKVEQLDAHLWKMLNTVRADTAKAQPTTYEGPKACDISDDKNSEGETVRTYCKLDRNKITKGEGQRPIYWRDYYIHTNIMPLFEGHLMITYKEHEPQFVNAKTIQDMMDLVFKLPGYRIFYNHVSMNKDGSEYANCGSSIPEHCHYQAIPEHLSDELIHGLPVESAKTELIADIDGISISKTTDYPTRALVIEGLDKVGVVSHAYKIIELLEELIKRKIAGEDTGIVGYNILWTSRDNKARIFIFPRAKDNKPSLTPQTKDEEDQYKALSDEDKVRFGKYWIRVASIEMSGVVINSEPSSFKRLDAGVADKILDECSTPEDKLMPIYEELIRTAHFLETSFVIDIPDVPITPSSDFGGLVFDPRVSKIQERQSGKAIYIVNLHQAIYFIMQQENMPRNIAVINFDRHEDMGGLDFSVSDMGEADWGSYAKRAGLFSNFIWVQPRSSEKDEWKDKQSAWKVSSIPSIVQPVLVTICYDYFAGTQLRKNITREDIDRNISEIMTYLRKIRGSIIGIVLARSPNWTQKEHIEYIETRLKYELEKLLLEDYIKIGAAKGTTGAIVSALQKLIPAMSTEADEKKGTGDVFLVRKDVNIATLGIVAANVTRATPVSFIVPDEQTKIALAHMGINKNSIILENSVIEQSLCVAAEKMGVHNIRLFYATAQDVPLLKKGHVVFSGSSIEIEPIEINITILKQIQQRLFVVHIIVSDENVEAARKAYEYARRTYKKAL